MRARRLAAALVACGTACAGLNSLTQSGEPASAAAAHQALVVGKTNWPVLGGNTGAGAKAFGDQLSLAGYGTTIDTNGRYVDQVFDEVPQQEVLFIHGHGHPGNITSEDTSATGQNQYFLAEIPVGTWDIQPPPQYVEWDDYLPASQVDGLLLAVLSACQTAEAHETWGSLPDTLAAKGVDTTITMFGKPLIPAASNPSPLSYGNYYWARVGYYLRIGNTVSLATSKAVQDLIAKEGSASGWNRYHISGAVASPGSTKIVPPRPGTTLLPATGLTPGTVSSLTVTASRPEALPTGGVIDSETDEGITLRRDAESGQLLGAWGTPAVTGPETISPSGAADLAAEFLASELPNGYQVVYTTTQRTEPVVDAQVLSTEIRLLNHDGREGLALIDVDLRSGKIVGFSLGQAGIESVHDTAVSKRQAEQTALQITGGGTITQTTLRSWTDSRWVVSIEQGEFEGYPMAKEVSVDAVTGAVLSQATS